jgi:hypothetical protein
MACPQTFLEATKHAKEDQHIFISENKKPSFVPCLRHNNPNPLASLFKVHKLTRDEMDEHQLKGIFYNCDEKYFSGNKCKEQKLFMAISEDVHEEDVTVPLVEDPSLLDAT